MYLILIATSFLGSVAFSLFLRRFGKSEHHLSRLKKTMHLHEHTLVELSKQQEEKIKDAFLDYEMLLEQSQQVHGQLNKGLEDYQTRLAQLSEEQNIISEISELLNTTASNASTVGTQVERLDIGLQKLKQANQSIQSFEKHIHDMRQEVQKNSTHVEERLDEYYMQLSEKANLNVTQINEKNQANWQRLLKEHELLQASITSGKKEMNELSERLDLLPAHLSDKWIKEIRQIEHKSQNLEQSLKERYANLDEKLGDMRKVAVEALQDELQNMHKEMEGLDLQIISRRDEIMNEAKRMAHKVQEQAQLFQENYLESENLLIKKTEEHEQEIQNIIKKLSVQWQKEQSVRLEESSHLMVSLREDVQALRKDKVTTLEAELEHAQTQMSRLFKESESKLEASLEEACKERYTELEKHANVLLEERLVQTQDEIYDTLEKIQAQKSIVSEMEKQAYVLNEKQRKAGEQIYTELETHANTLLERQEEAQGKLEDNNRKFIEEQESMYQELQAVASNVEEDLQERLDTKGLLNTFTDKVDKILEDRLNQAHSDIEASLVKLHSQKEETNNEVYEAGKIIFAELQSQSSLLKETYTEYEQHFNELLEKQSDARIDLEKYLNELSQRQEALDGKANDMSMQQIKQNEELCEELKSYSLELSKKLSIEVEDKHRMIHTQAEEYMARQENVYEELRQAAARVEEDLRTRLNLEGYLEELEETGSLRIEEMKRQMLVALDSLGVQKDKILIDLDASHKQLDNFTESLGAIEQAEKFAVQLDETLTVLDERLQLAQNENERISEYAQNFEKMRMSRQEIESELRLLEAQRSRLGEAEKQIESLQDKMGLLAEAKRLAISIEKRVGHFNEFKEAFDHYFGNMKEKKQYVEGALSKIEKEMQSSFKTNEQAQQLLEQVNRTESRQEHLHDRLQQFELRANVLEGMQKKIQKTE